jgi:DNA-binding transcriptional ArsR family regulator
MSETPASGPDAAPSGPDVPTPPAPPEPPTPPRFTGKTHEKITDPERMKALAHPARMAVFDFLAGQRVAGFEGATATEIAEVAGMTPSAMSYHLRTLAKAGFIEEAPSRGDARERLWRMKIRSFSIRAEDDASEGDKVIERTMGEMFLEQHDRNFLRWLDQRFEVDPALREAALTQQAHLRLTVDEAAEFKRRYQELEQEYADKTAKRAEQGPDPEDGTVVFHTLLRFFPRV